MENVRMATTPNQTLFPDSHSPSSPTSTPDYGNVNPPQLSHKWKLPPHNWLWIIKEILFGDMTYYKIWGTDSLKCNERSLKCKYFIIYSSGFFVLFFAIVQVQSWLKYRAKEERPQLYSYFGPLNSGFFLLSYSFVMYGSLNLNLRNNRVFLDIRAVDDAGGEYNLTNPSLQLGG